MRTEPLGMEVEPACEANHWRVGGAWLMEGHSSKGYHGIFAQWIDLLGILGGPTLIVGEGDEVAASHFRARFPQLDPITSTDRAQWDICKAGPLDTYRLVVCQAVVEHVVNPVAAIQHLANAVIDGGILLLHTHGPSFPQHRFPLDCYRFMPDAIPAIAAHLGLTLHDYLWDPFHVFAVLGAP